MTEKELRREVMIFIWSSPSRRKASVSNEVLVAAGLGRIVPQESVEGKFVGVSTNIAALIAWLDSFPFKVWTDLDHERGMIHIERI